MCGIAGIVDLKGGAVAPGAIERLTGLIAHRGPDGAGFWLSDDKRIALGHRRLAIIDPGARGNQPMASGDGRYVIAYNGEVYNFLELREELEALGIAFRTESDTEVILAAWQAWGPDMLLRFNGMWALAIVDKVSGDVFLARDRFGIKPLLYSVSEQRLVFASEMRALIGSGLVSTEIDVDVARRILVDAFGVEGSERTLHREVRRLQGGHYLWIKSGRTSVTRWWRTVDHLPQLPSTEAERVERFGEIFSRCGRFAHAQRRADRHLPVRRVRFVGDHLHDGRGREGGHGSARQPCLAPRIRRLVSGGRLRRATAGRGGCCLGWRCSEHPARSEPMMR